MARYTGPKCKLFRREGINIFDPNTSKFKTMTKKAYPPGAHGKNAFRKLSEYAKQLREKQKAKRIYGVLEKQFKSYYQEAARAQDITGDALLKLCERRLDNVVYRAGLAKTRPHARQMTAHGTFMLNGKRVTIPSIKVKPEDKITLRTQSQSHKHFKDFKKKSDTSPKWMKVDLGNFSVEISALPEADDLEKSINSKAIVEFYSK